MSEMLIGEIRDLIQKGCDVPVELTFELLKDYCLVIEDNTRLRAERDHLVKSLHFATLEYCRLGAENEVLINESDDGVDGVV